MTDKKSENICRICGKKYKSKYKYSKTCSKQCANEWQSRVNKGIAIKKFNDRNKGRYFYVSGYEHYESDFYVRCVACDSIVHIGKCMFRRVIKDCPICAKQDRENRRKHDREIKLREIANKKIERELISAKRKAEKDKPRLCLFCGKEVSRETGRYKYCSDMCCKRAGYRKKEATRRMLISDNGVVHWDISIERLIKRDKGVCHICGEKIDTHDYKHINGTYIAGLRHPSIDHIIPLSKGGTHTWNNVKLAHMGCNNTKNNKIIYEGPDKQMVIAI